MNEYEALAQRYWKGKPKVLLTVQALHCPYTTHSDWLENEPKPPQWQQMTNCLSHHGFMITDPFIQLYSFQKPMENVTGNFPSVSELVVYSWW